MFSGEVNVSWVGFFLFAFRKCIVTNMKTHSLNQALERQRLVAKFLKKQRNFIHLMRIYSVTLRDRYLNPRWWNIKCALFAGLLKLLALTHN